MVSLIGSPQVIRKLKWFFIFILSLLAEQKDENKKDLIAGGNRDFDEWFPQPDHRR
jgi:hypothetical protein